MKHRISIWTVLFLMFGCFLSFIETIENTEVVDGEDGEKFNEDIDLRGRWSYAPPQIERFCAKKCKNNSKPFGRLIGARCQCLCPINAVDYDLCANGPKFCYGFCQQIGFRAGGDCLYNSNCFCFCNKNQDYDVSIVYTTPSSVKNAGVIKTMK